MELGSVFEESLYKFRLCKCVILLLVQVNGTSARHSYRRTVLADKRYCRG